MMRFLCYNTSNVYIPVTAHQRLLVLQLRGAKAMSHSITIPLSKTGKYAGQFEAIVSEEDKDLADITWTLHKSRKICYALHHQDNAIAIKMHRLILERMEDGKPLQEDEEVDHVDGNGLNNQRHNLRRATPSQNAMNRGIRSDNTTGSKGVTWEQSSQKYRVRIAVNGRRFHVGRFDSLEEATRAYEEKARELHGKFANLHGFVRED